ncbi:MAG: ABC transporter ATP-binding protein [Bacteroidota bacterium]
MATIQSVGLGKRFGEHWLFRNLNFSLHKGDKLAVTGNNGSGKSTLLQLISGHMRATEGQIKMTVGGSEIPADNWFQHLAWTAPYIDIIEEFTASEFLKFYGEHKKMINALSPEEIISMCSLNEYAKQSISSYSSGMKQRLKLACTILTDVPLLLLDEPLTNLDESGNHFYAQLIAEFTKDKTVIVCSNDLENEISFCNKKIKISDYH